MTMVWMSYLWVSFTRIHLYGEDAGSRRVHKIFGTTAIVFSAALLLNLVVPIFFRVGADNIYQDTSMTVLPSVFLILGMLHGVGDYVNFDAKVKHVRFFPVAVFLVPIAIGVVLQNMVYSIPLIWPSLSVSISGVLMELLSEAASTDSQTGMLNRSFLYKSRPYESCNGAIMLDINGFKQINDECGHLEGDEAIKAAADILLSLCRRSDFAVRYGGDEFMLFLKQSDEKSLQIYMEQIRHAFAKYSAESGKPYELCASMGHVLYDPATEDIDTIIRTMDADMYRNKRKFYEEGHERRHFQGAH